MFRGVNKPKTAIDFSDDESALKTLKLGYNNVHSLPPFLFEYLKNLERLELNNNPMVVIDQNTQTALGHLKKLQVNYRIFPRPRRADNDNNNNTFSISVLGLRVHGYIENPRRPVLAIVQRPNVVFERQ